MEIQNEDNKLNFEKLCRCCLEESDDLRSLFKEGVILGYTTSMKDVLQEFTPISINENDDLPQKICFKCVIDASRSFIFHHTCMKTDSTLREYLISAGIKTKSEIKVEKLMGDGTLYFYDELDEIDDNDNLEELEIINNKNTELEEDFVNEIENDDNISENSDLKNDDKDNESIKSDIKIYSIVNGEEANNDEIETDVYNDFDNLFQVNEDEIDTKSNNKYDNLNLKELKSKNIYNKIQRSPPIKTVNTLNSRKRKPRLRKITGPPYKCEICGKLLSTHSSYNYHKQLHSDKTPFLCSECGQGFKTRNAYDGHMTLHMGGHKCSICNNTYRQIGSLKAHMLMHTGERPYLCGICGKGMTQKSGYKKHMLTHSGEKPYQCDICEKEFRYSSNLIAHKKSHTELKIYTCEICDKSFLTKEQLKRHTLIHTGEKPFDCKECGKVFNRKSSLTVHMHLHTGNRKHICVLCGKSYIQLQALQTHMKSHSDKDSNLTEQESGNSEEILIEEICCITTDE